MPSRRKSEGVTLLGVAILGFVHEFVISDEAEYLPIILFALVAIRGISKFVERDR